MKVRFGNLKNLLLGALVFAITAGFGLQSFAGETFKQGTKAVTPLDKFHAANRLKKSVAKTGKLDSASKANTSAGKPDSLQLSKIDAYNLHSFYMNNREWVTGLTESFVSQHPILKTFYKTKANLLEVNEKDFFLFGIYPIKHYRIFAGNMQSHN